MSWKVPVEKIETTAHKLVLQGSDLKDSSNSFLKKVNSCLNCLNFFKKKLNVISDHNAFWGIFCAYAQCYISKWFTANGWAIVLLSPMLRPCMYIREFLKSIGIRKVCRNYHLDTQVTEIKKKQLENLYTLKFSFIVQNYRSCFTIPCKSFVKSFIAATVV